MRQKQAYAVVEKDYEARIARLLAPHAKVEREPVLKDRKSTPDMRATLSDGETCIVECTSVKACPAKCKKDHVFGYRQPMDLHFGYYGAVEKKLRHYTPEKIGDFPFVVAVANQSCSNYMTTAIETAFGTLRLTSEGQLYDLWHDSIYEGGIFGNYPHCSGIVQSNGTDDLFIPNPNASHAVDERFFPFASIAIGDRNAISIRQPASPPDDHPFRLVGSVVCDGEPEIGKKLRRVPNLLFDTVFEQVSEEDGVPGYVVKMVAIDDLRKSPQKD